MDSVTVIVGVLATYRLTRFLLYDAGPLRLAERLRDRAGVGRYDENGKQRALADLFSCTWCMSVWVGAGIAVLLYFAPHVGPWLCTPFALSSGAGLLKEWIYGPE